MSLNREYETQLRDQQIELEYTLKNVRDDLEIAITEKDMAQLPLLCRRYADTFDQYAILTAKLKLFGGEKQE